MLCFCFLAISPSSTSTTSCKISLNHPASSQSGRNSTKSASFAHKHYVYAFMQLLCPPTVVNIRNSISTWTMLKGLLKKGFANSIKSRAFGGEAVEGNPSSYPFGGGNKNALALTAWDKRGLSDIEQSRSANCSPRKIEWIKIPPRCIFICDLLTLHENQLYFSSTQN